MRSPRLWLLLGVVLATSCVILVDPGSDGSGGGFDGGGGGGDLPDIGFPNGWDGGLPVGGLDGGVSPGDVDGGFVPPVPPFPGSGRNGWRGTGVLWFVRIDRSTANLASEYEKIIAQTNTLLTLAGFQVNGTGVVALYGGDNWLLWNQSTAFQPRAPLSTALRYFASTAGMFPANECPTTNLFSRGWDNDLAYDVDPTGFSNEVDNNPTFGRPPDALLIGFIDNKARPDSLGDTSCLYNGATPEQVLGATTPNASSLWSTIGTYGYTILPPRVRFLFVATPEGVSTDTMRSQCLQQASFPTSVLDSLGPSPQLFFDPLAQQLPDLSLRVDLCQALAGTAQQDATAFIQQWAQQLIQSVSP